MNKEQLLTVLAMQLRLDGDLIIEASAKHVSVAEPISSVEYIIKNKKLDTLSPRSDEPALLDGIGDYLKGNDIDTMRLRKLTLTREVKLLSHSEDEYFREMAKLELMSVDIKMQNITLIKRILERLK